VLIPNRRYSLCSGAEMLQRFLVFLIPLPHSKKIKERLNVIFLDEKMEEGG